MATARKFKDAEGRTWIVEIDYSTIKAVRKADIGVDLATVMGDNLKGWRELHEDCVKFIDMMWVIVHDQHDSVTDEEFGCSLKGDALGAAREAFTMAYADFCPSDQREVLTTMIAKNKEIQQEGLKEMKSLTLGDVISGSLDMNSPQLRVSPGESKRSRSAS